MRIRDPRNYLINKKMQLGLTLRFLVLTILFTLFIEFEVYISVWPVITGYIPKDLMGHVTNQILFRFLCFFVPVILVIAMFTIIFSHRIAGPIYNIERKLDGLIRGEDVGLIRLRKGDELKELAEKINKLMLIVEKSKASINQKQLR